MSKTKRLFSMFLDHVFITVIALIVSELLENMTKLEQSRIGDITLAIAFFISLNKDFYNGRSVAKRILSLQIIDKTGLSGASQLQCFIRNLLILIWPLEVIFVLINPERRLGDIFAGTKVLELKNKVVKQKKDATNNYIILLTIILSLCYAFLLVFLLTHLF